MITAAPMTTPTTTPMKYDVPHNAPQNATHKGSTMPGFWLNGQFIPMAEMSLEMSPGMSAKTPTERTLLAVLAYLGYGGEHRGIAIARNDEIVPRHQWPATIIQPNDRIEVVTAVQGG